MVTVRKLLEPLFCLASVSATEKASSETFAQAAVNAINKDESSGETAVRKLLEPLFCLASVSATEKALSETFAQAAVNAINKDESSGDKLYVLHEYDEVKETDN
ncbi:hypothetical protein M513_13256 [Trichuris suis]|uniref:Uncharacterized protein n=1 Tax=Trichuris suis TaxID=68888 RepID=A0A085LLM0_9BILA|nr:hypothetical protein M513_13256 [Trichuris suis]